MGSLAGAADLVEILATDDTLRVYTDPAEALSNRPCVLVAPPQTDYRDKLRTWGLKCLTGQDVGNLDAWIELDALEAKVVALLPVETSTPASYRLSDDQPLIPCHVLTVRTSAT